MYTFLALHARRYNQRGFCFGYRGSEHRCVVNDQDFMDGEALTPYDGTAAVLNEWAGKIYPGFVTKGYFPRDVLYVQRKLREHGIV